MPIPEVNIIIYKYSMSKARSLIWNPLWGVYLLLLDCLIKKQMLILSWELSQWINYNDRTRKSSSGISYPENGDSLSFGSIPCSRTSNNLFSFPLRALSNIIFLGSLSSLLMNHRVGLNFPEVRTPAEAAAPMLFTRYFCLMVVSF